MTLPRASAPDLKLARRAATFGLCAAFLSSAGQTFLIGLFGVAFRTEFALTEGALGTIYGAATLASGLLMFWLGALADRLSPRQAIAVALVVLGAGALLVAFAPAPGWLLPGLFLLRLGGQGLTGHIAIVAAARHGGGRRGRSVATAAFGFILGEALLPLGITAALGVVGWRWLWTGVGLFILVAAMPLMRLLAAPLPGSPSSGEAEAGSPTGRWRLLRDGRFLAALSVVLVAPFVITAVFLHQGTLAHAKDWLPAQVATAFLGFAAFQAVATWSSGRLVDHIGSHGLMRAYLLPLALGVLGLGFVEGPAALWLLFCGLGLTAGSNAVVAGAVWVEVFGTHRLGMVRGVYAGLMVVATAVSPALLGLALAAGISLRSMALGTAAYVAVVPLMAVGRLGRNDPGDGIDGAPAIG
jgi:MFS family permease